MSMSRQRNCTRTRCSSPDVMAGQSTPAFMAGRMPTLIRSRPSRRASCGRRALALAALTLLIAAGQAGLAIPAQAAGAGCRMRLSAGEHVVQVTAGGLRRSALVEIPSGGAPRRPLVLALHGWGSSGQKMASYSGLSPVAARAGFVIAYPSSHGPGWNSTASRRGAGDVAFLRTL